VLAHDQTRLGLSRPYLCFAHSLRLSLFVLALPSSSVISRTSLSSLGSKKTETAVKEMRRLPDRRQETECALRNALLDSSGHNGGPMMSFRISGLPADQFADLFALSDQELVARGAVRRVADERTPGYPCRISLTDSRPGDELLLVNYEHHPVSSPYRM